MSDELKVKLFITFAKKLKVQKNVTFLIKINRRIKQ